MTFAEKLKEVSPKAFEKFRSEWLRQNFPYWNEEETPKIYFCEMPFEMQGIYFCKYLQTIPKLGAFYRLIDTNNLYRLQAEIMGAFNYLEEKTI
jgi:hypothetical protein